MIVKSPTTTGDYGLFLFDVGYQEIKRADLLAAVVMKLSAILVDIRFSPHSRQPQWSGKALRARLGERYYHLKELGNAAYKEQGVIDFVDLDKGMAVLKDLLLLNRPAIVMCACWDRYRCHRHSLVKEFEEVYGIQSVPLDKATCLSLCPEFDDPLRTFQLPLPLL